MPDRAARRNPKAVNAEQLEARLLLSSTWVVTSTADDGSSGTLRFAVDHSSAGDTIQFDPSLFSPSNQTAIQVLNTPLEINHDLSILGPGLEQLNVESGFLVDGSAHAAISGLDIAPGLITVSSGSTLDLTRISGVSFARSNFNVVSEWRRRGSTSQRCASVLASNYSRRVPSAPFTTRVHSALSTAPSSYNSIFCFRSERQRRRDNKRGNWFSRTIVDSTFSNKMQPYRGRCHRQLRHSDDAISGCTLDIRISLPDVLLDSRPLHGGAAVYSEGVLDLVNSTLYWNSAYNGSGAGIYVTGQATLTNSTIAENFALGGSGVDVQDPAAVTINNTIVASNWISPIGAPSQNYSDIAGNVTGSFNLIGTWRILRADPRHRRQHRRRRRSRPRTDLQQWRPGSNHGAQVGQPGFRRGLERAGGRRAGPAAGERSARPAAPRRQRGRHRGGYEAQSPVALASSVVALLPAGPRLSRPQLGRRPRRGDLQRLSYHVPRRCIADASRRRHHRARLA